MSQQHTGKLLIRFIKDFASVIKESRVAPTRAMRPCETFEGKGTWKKEKEATRWKLRNTTRHTYHNSKIFRRHYHSNVIEHYENPMNVGSLNKDDKEVEITNMKKRIEQLENLVKKS